LPWWAENFQTIPESRGTFSAERAQTPSVMNENYNTNDEVLDKPTAAELLKISTRTLDDWMRKKRIPFCKLPSGTVRFRRAQLMDFISKYEVTQ
jgi:excisionase family DNA binding protein